MNIEKSKETILIIEDEKNILELIQYHLNREGYALRTSMDGEKGFEIARKEKFSLLILDLMLPSMSGIEICKALKASDRTRDLPIIMLSAKSQDTDVILGLELGADDYVTKPFSPRQLIARVKAVLRRSQEKSQKRILSAGTLELDAASYVVTVKGKSIDLTSKEFGILKLFLESGERVFSRESILEKVWGHDESLHVDERVVDKHIAELRGELKSEGDRIITIPRAGYKFQA